MVGLDDDNIIVVVLGQWASGKSTAASTLVRYLGGDDKVAFITDRVLVASQAVKYILNLEEAQVERSIEDDGRLRLAGELAAVHLRPGEELETVDLNNLLFDLSDEVYDNIAAGSNSWLDKARLELGYHLLERSTEGKPIVIEAGFGTNTKPRGESPFSHTIADLFERLEEAGVELNKLKWIIIEAGYKKRSERNQKRRDSVPAVEFDRFAADGGDLDPDYENRLVEQGTAIKRVPNDHDDIERFRADIIAAFEELYRGVLPGISPEDKQDLGITTQG